jgi:hypothetical protein
MKLLKILLTSSFFFITAFTLSGCENTSVSGSVSYGMGMGMGYPMYYGGGYHHSNVVVVRPPRHNRPSTRPSRPRRR